MIDTIIEIFGELKRNKLRTIATGFAVSSGLFLMIVLQGAGNGLIHSFSNNMKGMATDVVRVFGGMTTMPYEGIKEGRMIELEDRDVNMTSHSFPDRVTDVIPTVKKEGLTATRGGNYISSASVVGVYPKYESIDAIKIIEGRFINDIDIQLSRKVIVISNKNEEDLFKNGQKALGNYIKIGTVMYQVVGIFKADEMRETSDLYIPFTTLSTIYNRGRKIDELTMNINVEPTDSAMDKFEKDYTRASSYIHSFSPKDESALWIWNEAKGNMEMTKAMDILRNAFWILGILTLISGIVGVSNIMLISVKERTREFGIRRAIGARPWSIIRMVILESVIITTIFGYIGMFLGIFFCEWMDKTVGNQTMDVGVFKAKYFVDPTVDLSICIEATIIIIIAGALAGFFPARKAVKVKPVEALKG